jgi:hypothetical protein
MDGGDHGCWGSNVDADGGVEVAARVHVKRKGVDNRPFDDLSVPVCSKGVAR